ncbi:hypothetical protein [Mariniblastus fucicola]|uniref:Uncharacterized protein n=1 Tax=Mariniblastus fucicola TaxID=980251 RepID=A0A5B9PJ51_9BACT|nr:hypothetical protein [Mariniblastus fucicola]QEG25275.1 hypothetical protein MFFC18_51990 [Mariniblastus fucicola]
MAKKKQRNGRLFVIITVISTIIIVPLTYAILSAYGEKSGIEFSPDDFSMRRFNYCNFPIVNWTRRGIKYTDVENGTALMLIDDDWIRETGRTPKRWHLVSENGGNFSTTRKISADCDARFLTNYFDLSNNEGEIYVSKWTDDNPDSAKIFWPLIAEMARDDLYLPIPELIEFVLDYPDPDKDDEFPVKLRKRVADAWYQAGLTDQLNGSHEKATARFDMAIATGEGHERAEQAKLDSESASSP